MSVLFAELTSLQYVNDMLDFFFYVNGSVHHESLSIIVQQVATIYSFIIFSADSSTCFG